MSWSPVYPTKSAPNTVAYKLAIHTELYSQKLKKRLTDVPAKELEAVIEQEKSDYYQALALCKQNPGSQALNCPDWLKELEEIKPLQALPQGQAVHNCGIQVHLK
jgi:hypothetical protein